MNRKSVLTFAFALLMMLPLCAETYEVKVGEFTKLRIVNNLEVIYHCNPDSAGYAVLTNCPQGMASSVIFTNNGTLRVETATDYSDMSNLPTVHVYSSFLKSVKSSSEKTVTILSPAPMPEFAATLYGNGNIMVEGLQATVVKSKLMTGHGTITLSGKCEQAKFNLTGTGEIRADELVAQSVKCSIWGTGAIYCQPIEKLKSDGIGSTRIYYVGSPRKIKKTGGGKILPLSSLQDDDAEE